MAIDGVATLIASGFGGDLARLLVRHSRAVTLPRGDCLFREGDDCESFVFVISGSLKIQRPTPEGHELVLYRVDAGQECHLASACLLGGERYSATAVAEEASEVLIIPRSDFFQLLEQQPDFRAFIYRNIEHGMTELLDLVQEVAFDPMVHRLAVVLIKRSHAGAVVATTHEELALELGSAREVISRLLKGFEHKGWVRLHRGLIEIVDSVALAKL